MLHTLAAIFGLDLLPFLVALWCARRYLVRPVPMIREGTRRIQAGDFTHQQERGPTAVRASEQRFRALFEEAPVAYHEIDRDGIVRRVNRAECRLLGFEAWEMLGKPIWEFVAPEQREYAVSVLHSGEALLTVINDILDFSKVEAGKLELEHLPFDLAATVEEVASVLALRAAAKGLGWLAWSVPKRRAWFAAIPDGCARS